MPESRRILRAYVMWRHPPRPDPELAFGRPELAARGQVHALFAQAMGYVAVTAGMFALGAWLGRGLSGGAGIVIFIPAFAVLIGMRFAAKRSTELTVGLLVGTAGLDRGRTRAGFVNIPGAALAYSVLGLVIFAGFTMFDFQRLRRNTDAASAPLLAASIFLDIVNVFLFFLEIFSGGREA
jgi:FtsH-binding integral membrane protein